MSDELEQLVQSAQADIAACADARTLETLRVDLLGKKGRVTDLLKQLGGMAPEARKAFGEQVNRAKEALSSALETRGDELARIALDARLASERIDVTLAGRGEPVGGLHPITRTTKRIAEIFGEKHGRAHVCTPVTNPHLVCRTLLGKKKNTNAE